MDITRLAGLYPAGVICEVMNDDGTMARVPDLVKFAQMHGLKVGTIADLIAYRRRHDTLVARVFETTITTATAGKFRAVVYRNTLNNQEHLALIKGNLPKSQPILTRMHAENFLYDVLGSDGARSQTLRRSLEILDENGSGVAVIIRNPSPTPLSDLRTEGRRAENFILKEYGVGAQIITDLGIEKLMLLSDTPHTVVALEGYKLEIVGQKPILGCARSWCAQASGIGKPSAQAGAQKASPKMSAPNILLVAAPYYADLTAGLERSARAALEQVGAIGDMVSVGWGVGDSHRHSLGEPEPQSL